MNGFKVREGRHIDPEGQFERAVEAFGRNGFLLVDDLQVDDLEETIEVGLATTVAFLKLVPFVEGLGAVLGEEGVADPYKTLV